MIKSSVGDEMGSTPVRREGVCFSSFCLLVPRMERVYSCTARPFLKCPLTRVESLMVKIMPKTKHNAGCVHDERTNATKDYRCVTMSGMSNKTKKNLRETFPRFIAALALGAVSGI